MKALKKKEDESIKNYNVYEQLGRGGFAQVYRAQEKGTNKEVAIKMVRSRSVSSNQLLNQIKLNYFF
jgi:serine/threonine protein kinase